MDLLDKFFEENKREALNGELNPGRYELLGRRLKKEIDEQIAPPARWRPVLYRVAASLALIGIVAYLVILQRNDQPVTQEVPAMLTRLTDRGQKVTLRLPDGTVVKLNSRSRLAFPEKFTGRTREVSLQGEAYFEVVHNPASPFIVSTSNSSVQVLGTSFNVNEKSTRGTEVTLVTGKVEVSSGNATPVQLKPNQQAVIRSDKAVIDTSAVDVSRFIEWKDDVLRFDKMPMTEVVSKLEDWYGTEIVIRTKAIEGCRITARYDSESLENVLKSLEFMLKGKYTLRDGKATISGKGCNGNE
jgi:ferric-dicitrate binding protein FerR (iron transport regulator)